MATINVTKPLQIEDGNTVRFEAMAENGRIHLEGTGPIVVEVSLNGVDYNRVEHAKTFTNGKMESPFRFYVGDHVRISATTITDAQINYSRVEMAERR